MIWKKIKYTIIPQPIPSAGITLLFAKVCAGLDPASFPEPKTTPNPNQNGVIRLLGSGGGLTKSSGVRV